MCSDRVENTLLSGGVTSNARFLTSAVLHMSKINSISEKDKIIAAATAMLARQHGKRKTTMAELANDLGFSRTLLYYYFPDKAAIFKAAVAKVADEHYGNLVKLSNSGTLSARDEMRTSLRQRADLGRNFYAFGLYTVMVVYQNDPEMQEIRQREINYYENLLKRGMKKGEFRKVDARGTAELIVDTVDGITNIHLSRHDETNNTFDDVYPRLIAASDLLVAAVLAPK